MILKCIKQNSVDYIQNDGVLTIFKQFKADNSLYFFRASSFNESFYKSIIEIDNEQLQRETKRARIRPITELF